MNQPHQPQRVLVVDDEEGIQLTLGDILEMEGYDVRIVSNGREALEVVAVWRPDVILLDLMMPVMSGVAFREAQLAQPDGVSAIPVVVLSGAHDAPVRADAMRAAAVLRKPFDLDDVLATVALAIDGYPKPG